MLPKNRAHLDLVLRDIHRELTQEYLASLRRCGGPGSRLLRRAWRGAPCRRRLGLVAEQLLLRAVVGVEAGGRGMCLHLNII